MEPEVCPLLSRRCVMVSSEASTEITKLHGTI